MATSAKPQQLTPFGAALAGALGGCFSNAIVYPLDVAKTRIQAANEEDSKDQAKLSMKAVLLRIWQEEGLAGYFRGFGATMLNTFSMQYAYFFFYSIVRTSYLKRLAARSKSGKAPVLSTAAELALGAIAGALAQVFTIPVAVIATRQQIGHSLDKQMKRKRAEAGAAEKALAGEGKAYAQAVDPDVPPVEVPGLAEGEGEDEDYSDSFLDVAREIVREEGVTGLWLGLKPGLVLTVNPAITYGMFERLKNVVLTAKGQGENAKLGPSLSFVVGALSKTMATVVTYPYIMAKVRIQARSADAEAAQEEHASLPHHNRPHHPHTPGQHGHVGALDILVRVWRHQGIKGWYQGMSAQITKAVLSQALLFMSKDLFEQYALAIMLVLYKLRR
ncbi:mitochondrial carrier [Punctularia strigosozonata HHB-11173 SS5]|uniref:mitochondrial carrier n=1 Tax=Punctularia strigosozonata (strain HHB-11173) TaxID=741275 RepID=UPI00044181B8|nr:mitochondrial carrier [Punctularia strigosozonata HHB-11173 SS5]EIN09876.1 mitochondrial carrier [Punctularia strigosozonata HHB-11173 SS5]